MLYSNAVYLSIREGVGMLTILFMLELAIMMAAASIVAWLRYPYKDSDDYRLGCLRFLAPPSALLLFVVAIVECGSWLMGRSLGVPPPVGWVLVAAPFMAAYVIWAIHEIRVPRAVRLARSERASRPPRTVRKSHDPRYVSFKRPRRASVTRTGHGRRS